MINATVFTFELKLLRSRHLHFCHLLSWLQSMCAMNKSRETFTTYTAARTMKHTTPHFFFRFYLVIILTLSWNCWDPYPCIFVTYHFGFSPCVQWTRAAKLSLLRRPYEQRSTPLHRAAFCPLFVWWGLGNSLLKFQGGHRKQKM